MLPLSQCREQAQFTEAPGLDLGLSYRGRS